MPIELVQLLLPRLNLVDCLHLFSVCKAWNSLSNHTQEAQVYPWFMYTENDSCLWRLFDPVYEKEYSVDMKWLGFSEDLTFHYSKDGWVIASKEFCSLFLINPLTRECISLPKTNFVHRRMPLAFSSAPTSPNCVVVMMVFIAKNVVQISTWTPGQEQWNNTNFHDEYGRFLPCNPVFTRGEFYWYRPGGELLIFNPYKKTLQVLEMKAPIEMPRWTGRVMECYMVDSGGDLITVFRGRTTEPMRIFKLDRLNMAWSEVDDVGDATIFLHPRTSIATSCLKKSCHSQIYLSGFAVNHCKSNAFYSLEIKSYHPEEYYNINDPKNCL